MIVAHSGCLFNYLNVLFFSSDVFSITEVVMTAKVRARTVNIGREALSAFVSGVSGTSNE